MHIILYKYIQHRSSVTGLAGPLKKLDSATPVPKCLIIHLSGDSLSLGWCLGQVGQVSYDSKPEEVLPTIENLFSHSEGGEIYSE